MFSKGDVVVYGTTGICEIKDISTLDIAGIEKSRMYYILYPKSNGGKIYVPVDTATSRMRRIITKEEAENLVAQIPKIDPLENCSEKTLEETYKRSLRTFDCVEWIRLIKYIYFRKKARQDAGKKVTAIDGKYMHLTEDILYQEIGEALGIPKDQVLEYITNQIENNK